MAQISPTPLDITLSASGALSPKATTFIDSLRVGAADVSLIGRWNFALQYKQNAGQGSVAAQGAESLMVPIVLPFFVQIDPCPVESIIALSKGESMRYVVDDDEAYSAEYIFE